PEGPRPARARERRRGALPRSRLLPSHDTPRSTRPLPPMAPASALGAAPSWRAGPRRSWPRATPPTACAILVDARAPARAWRERRRSELGSCVVSVRWRRLPRGPDEQRMCPKAADVCAVSGTTVAWRVARREVAMSHTEALHALVVFGTRPEAIKQAPVIWALRQRPDRFRVTALST